MVATARSTSAPVDRWMLPGELARAANPAGAPGPAARTPRDWAADVALFGIAVLVGIGEFSTTVLQDRYDLPM
ncbi:MAG: hypothetical protein ACR2FQ_00740 [Pseudonocardiaceae bacterium]